MSRNNVLSVDAGKHGALPNQLQLSACYLESRASAAAPTPTTAMVNSDPMPRLSPASDELCCILSGWHRSGRPH